MIMFGVAAWLDIVGAMLQHFCAVAWIGLWLIWLLSMFLVRVLGGILGVSFALLGFVCWICDLHFLYGGLVTLLWFGF